MNTGVSGRRLARQTSVGGQRDDAAASSHQTHTRVISVRNPAEQKRAERFCIRTATAGAATVAMKLWHAPGLAAGLTRNDAKHVLSQENSGRANDPNRCQVNAACRAICSLP